MKNQGISHIQCAFLVVALSASIFACTKDQNFGVDVAARDEIARMKSQLSGPVVCGFGGGSGGSGNSEKGLVSELLYMTPVSVIKPRTNNINLLSYYFYQQGGSTNGYAYDKRYASCTADSHSGHGEVMFTSDFIEGAHFGPIPTCSGLVAPSSYVDVAKATSQLFMRDLNVPPAVVNGVAQNNNNNCSTSTDPDSCGYQKFSDGFSYTNENGQVGILKTPNGDTLKEFFSLRVRGRLTLKDLSSTTYPDGNYELQMYSDDGSLLFFPQNGSDGSPVINFDGYHSPYNSSTVTVTLNHSGFREFKLNYFQGPADGIALRLKWKKPGSSSFTAIPADAYYLPEGVTNPCQ